MNPRLDQLDPRFQALILRRLGTFYGAPFDKEFLKSLPRKVWFVRVPEEWGIGQYDWTGKPEAEELNRRYETRVWLGVLSHFFGICLTVGSALAVYIGADPLLALPFFLGGLGLGVMPWLFEYGWRKRLRRGVTWEELRLALAEESLSRAERRYLAILEEAYAMPESARADVERILVSVNEVLQQYQELEQRRLHLPAGPDDASIARNEAEMERVRKALEDETDAVVRAAHQERLRTLEATNENLRRVGTLGRRVAVQMRAMETLLEGVTAGLRRMRLTPTLDIGFETNELAERLHRMARDSAAMEAAEEELRKIHEGL